MPLLPAYPALLAVCPSKCSAPSAALSLALITPAAIPRFDKDLGTFVGDLRAWVFTSQSKAARYFGVSHSTISRYENGRLAPPLSYVTTLAQLVAERFAETGMPLDSLQHALLHELNQVIKLCYPDERLVRQWAELTAPVAAPATPATPALAAPLTDKALPPPLAFVDWGEAPDVQLFYGRQSELTWLERRLGQERCRLVAVLGMGGVGKTALVTRVAWQTRPQFAIIIWRSLRNAPPLSEIITGLLHTLSRTVEPSEPATANDQQAALFAYLRQQRCLLILDNAESIMQGGGQVGDYRPGYEAYGEFLRRWAETDHQSCLLLTSREKPGELEAWAGESGPVRILQLRGIDASTGQQILQDRALAGPPESWQALIDRCSGNPLALKFVAETIREIFAGDIATFLADATAMSHNVRRLLDQQFARLTALEREVMFWLAVNREPVSLETLRRDIVRPAPPSALPQALQALRQRSLLEQSGQRFTLQNVVLEYTTDLLIQLLGDELLSEQGVLLHHLALLKVDAPEYVRQAQVRLLLAPVAQLLLNQLGKSAASAQLTALLAQWRSQGRARPGYGAGNLLNLLLQLGVPLRGLDFSHLVVWQAYLRDAQLPDVNFAQADLTRTLFSNAFVGVNVIALSPDGQLVAVATGEEVRLWQIATGQLYAILSGHRDLVWALAFSADGATLVSGGADCTVHVWDVQSQELLHVLRGHTHWVWAVALSPDGVLLASGSEDSTIRLWHLPTGRLLGVWPGHTGAVRALAFSTDGLRLASGGDQTVQLWDVPRQQRLARLSGPTGDVMAVAWSPDNRTVVSGGADRLLYVWDSQTGAIVQTLAGHLDTIAAVAFAPDHSLIASGSYDQTICLWQAQTGQVYRVLHGHTEAVRALAFDAQGKWLASGSYDRTIRLWAPQSGQMLYLLKGQSHMLKALALDPRGEWIAAGGADQIVRVWRLADGALHREWRGHTRWLTALAFHPTQPVLASAGYDRTIRLWSIEHKRLLHLLQGHEHWIWCVAFNPQGTLLASASADQTVRLWNVQGGQASHVLAGHTQGVTSLAFTADGGLLASGSADQTIRLWDVQRGAAVATLLTGTGQAPGAVTALAFSPDGRTLVSSGQATVLQQWDVATGSLIREYQTTGGAILALGLGADGYTIMVSTAHNLVETWDLRSGQPGPVLPRLAVLPAVLVFALAGQVIADGGFEGAIQLWRTLDGTLMRQLQIERPYERMDITGVTGLTEAQKAMLKTLGAYERPI